jgi:predicted ATPase
MHREKMILERSALVESVAAKVAEEAEVLCRSEFVFIHVTFSIASWTCALMS